ncbi:MAG: hypothetical protein ABIR39_19990 [Nocardioides sp.]|uniref:hypothetical protein n=1 Tax=Nocardioides sp. TaxID=35761 RepID=UPI003266D1EE
MSDPESELTPAQDDAVRALLASARHTDPTPPDVVARLDAALADLTADRGSAERLELAPVVTLGSRRRRTAGALLLAAAAVVVAGVGIGQVLPSNTSSDSAGSAADTTTSSELAESPMSDQGSDALGAESAAPTEKQPDAEQQAREASPFANPSPPALRSDSTTLKSQVRQLQRTTPYSSYAPDPACVPDEAEPGLEVGVTYDDQPAALVFRDVDAGAQQVDVFICGQPEPVRSLTFRAR